MNKNLRFAVLSAIFLLVPAFFINTVLQQYRLELEDNSLKTELNEARLIMAEIQGELSERQVVQNALDSYSADVRKMLAGSYISSDSAAKASRLFYEKFPAKSQLIWFSPELVAITPIGKPDLEQKRVWQAFARSIISPKKISAMELKLADGFVKSNFSDFLSCSYFSRLRKSCHMVLFKSERHYIGLCGFSSNSEASRQGFLIALIPADKARAGWLEERAMSNAARRGVLSGAYVVSQDLVVKNSKITENIMHGMICEFRNGKRFQRSHGFLHYCETQVGNPDLFLCVAMPVSENEQFWQSILAFMGSLVWMPGLLCLLLPFTDWANTGLDLSLKTRFRFAAASIAALPLLLAGVTGSIHAARTDLEVRNEEFQKLDRQLTTVEESVSLQTANYELYLKNELPRQYEDRVPDKKQADEILQIIKDRGGELVLLLTPSGESFVATELPPGKVKQRLSYLVNFLKYRLNLDKFDMQAINERFPLPTGSKKLYNLKTTDTLNSDFHNRINRFDLGGTIFSFFATNLYDKEGKILACLTIGFSYSKMQQKFLAGQFENLCHENYRIYVSTTLDHGFSILPKQDRLRNVVGLSLLTGDTFKFSQFYENHEYLVVSRPLKDIDSSAMMMVSRLSNNGLNPRREQALVLVLTSVPAILLSFLVIGLFSKLFLSPILRLAGLATRVAGGDYRESPDVSGNNEIAELSSNMSQIVRGLREKAEMKNYLRADLFEQAAGDGSKNAERANVTILFAGIREFSRLEDRLSPEAAMETMNRFLALCERATKDNGGDIDKFIGDTAMASFSNRQCVAPQTSAISAAIKIVAEIERQNQSCCQLDQLRVGVGIASGEVIAGHIGSLKKRLDYTFIGDTVNLAARLEKLAGRSGNPAILTTQGVAHEVKSLVNCFELPSMHIKGKLHEVRIFAVNSLLPEGAHE